MRQHTLDDLLYLMDRLRDPEDGCPWDRDQDFSSIIAHTIEESYELADAIHQQNFAHIQEELGDVLFQVVFYARLGKELGHFEFNDIVNGLVDKLLRRHPHVFPDGTLASRSGGKMVSTETIKQNWEAIKLAERQYKAQPGVLDDVPVSLPALSRAIKLQKRAAQTGFDWETIDGVLAQLQSELDELQQARQQQSEDNIRQEFGDVLFCMVNLARHLNIEPETALRGANRKFEARFRYIEQQLVLSGSTVEDASLQVMDKLWDEAKSQGL